MEVTPHICIFLPENQETSSLLQMYLTSTTYMFHVIHIPSVGNMVENVYEDLIRHNTFGPRHVALLMAILANTAFMLSAQSSNTSPFSTVEESHA
ncbi:hypothetical protein BDV59DRAFT_180116 [Aspergillus ambiguus]|uniref:uncharacterized protein n=1 Tax=Aspergillus ambiguus TaxID=176160 RepID=UPI003CCDE93C